MSGLEIFGAIATALGVTHKIITWFGTRRNAPRQVQRLERMLHELDDPRLLGRASAQERADIKRLVDTCTRLMRDAQDPAQGGSRSGRLYRFIFPAEAEARLKGHNDEISEELGRLWQRVHAFGYASPQASPEISPLPIIAEPLRRDTFATEATYVAPGSPSLIPRRGSVAAELPVKLTIQDCNGNPVIGPLRLHTLTLIEQDDDKRLIQYESKDRSVRITHRVPRGRYIRFEDDELDDLDVLFLDEHEMTVEDAEGYKVYQLQPKYQFRTVALREDFLTKVRQRDLLGRFHVEEVRRSKELVAQLTVVRFWSKKGDTRGPTMSFLGRDAVQHEWALVDFDKIPQAPRGDIVELLDSHDPRLRTVFRFKPPRSPKSPKVAASRSPKIPREKEEGRKPSFSFVRRKSSTPSAPAHSRRSTAEEIPLTALTDLSAAKDDQSSDADRFRRLFEDNHPKALPPPVLSLSLPGDAFPDAQSLFQRLPPAAMDPGGSSTSGSIIASSSASMASGSIYSRDDQSLSPLDRYWRHDK